MIRYMDKGTRVERGNMIDRILDFTDKCPKAFMTLSVVVALPVSVAIVGALYVMFAAAILG